MATRLYRRITMTNDPKTRWITLLIDSNIKDQRQILKVFCQNYYYFSLHQVQAFSQFIRLIPAENTTALAIVADALSDELGNGHADQVHSVLFKHFSLACGVKLDNPDEREIVQGVAKYVDTLFSGFGEQADLPIALASYFFLEESATQSYQSLLNAFKQCKLDFSETDLRFFSLHVTVEQGHLESAKVLQQQFYFDANQQQQFDLQTDRLNTLWQNFWRDILTESINAIRHGKQNQSCG